MSDIQESYVYKNAETKLPSIGQDSGNNNITEDDINKMMNDWIKGFNHLDKPYKIGQLYRKTRTHSKSGVLMLLNLLYAFKSVLELQFKETVDKTKRDILDNTIKSMEHMILLLKQTDVDVDRDDILALMRGFVS